MPTAAETQAISVRVRELTDRLIAEGVQPESVCGVLLAEIMLLQRDKKLPIQTLTSCAMVLKNRIAQLKG